MTDCDCGEHHPDGAKYYVSCVSGSRTALLAGPFANHADALSHVEPARAFAEKRDLWAHFYAFGTLAVAGDYNQPGVFNRELGIEVAQ